MRRLTNHWKLFHIENITGLVHVLFESVLNATELLLFLA